MNNKTTNPITQQTTIIKDGWFEIYSNDGYLLMQGEIPED